MIRLSIVMCCGLLLAGAVMTLPAQEAAAPPAAEAAAGPAPEAAAPAEAVVPAEAVIAVEAAPADPEPPAPDQLSARQADEVLKRYARLLYDSGRFEEALEVVVLLLKDAPEDRRLIEFRGRIQAAQSDLNTLRKYVDADAALNQVGVSSFAGDQPAAVDRPAGAPVIELVSGMNRDQREQVRARLQQRISLNLVDAQLPYVLNLLFRGTGINIIADQSVLAGKLLTIQVENIPLEAILNYIARMQGISYSISYETVWITTSDRPMLETRIIRLRTGLTDVLEQLDAGLSTQSASAGAGAAQAQAAPAAAAAGARPSIAQSDLERVLNRVADIIDWPAGSNWVLDRKTNTVFVRSTSDALDKFEKVIAAVDGAPLQVLIEAKFIEISDGDLRDVGIEWQFAEQVRIRGAGAEGVALETGSGTNFGFPARGSGKVDFTSNTTGMDLFLTGVLDAPAFDAVLHAIDTKDSSHTLSSPTLLTMNNFLGTIKVTTDLIYIESYTVDRSNIQRQVTSGTAPTTNYTLGDDDADGVANEDPPDGIDNDGDGNFDEDGLPWDYMNTTPSGLGSEPVIIPVFATDFEGVILKVLPSIGLDGEIITMTLQPEVTEKVGEQSFNLVIPNYSGTAEIVRPIMNRRTFVTKLSIQDGCTVVLGGLKREREIRSISRVPILGNIPLLGRLFSRNSTSTVSSNLLIFVTAHILAPSGNMYKDSTPQRAVTVTAPDGRTLTREELLDRIRQGQRQP
ncbi:MAG: hypothetical protein ABIF71_08145 [Planctomycetota bacterium]